MGKTESEANIIHGPPPLQEIPLTSFGIVLHEKLKQQRKSQKPSLVHAVTGETVSYQELFEGSCRLASALQRCGFGTNSVVAMYSENHLNFGFALVSALFIGAPLTPVNPNSTTRELLYLLKIGKPKLIFCSKSTLDKVLESNYAFEKIIVLDDGIFPDGVESLKECINKRSLPVDVMKFQPIRVNPEEHLSFIMYSSGTTGLPKGVMITHANLIARFAIVGDPRWFSFFEEDNVDITHLPLSHAYGLQRLLSTLYQVRTAVVLPKFDLELLLQTIEKYKPRNLTTVPPIALLLVKSPLIDKYDLSSLKFIASGAAPLHRDTEEALRKRLNLEAVMQGYGLTEVTLSVLASPPNSKKPGSVGILFPFMSAKVVDPETSKILGPNEPGELCFKGLLIMKGYLDNPEATRNVIDSEGWLHSGDIGYYDNDGYFYIVDRVKELIKYKGHQIAPAELEAILLSHPKIQDAAVVGLPDPYYGEKPIAFVVKYPGHELHEKEVLSYIESQVSREKKLHGVRFIDVIPKIPSGKILRRKLRELLNNQKSKL